jgi:hypothetical protein
MQIIFIQLLGLTLDLLALLKFIWVELDSNFININSSIQMKSKEDNNLIHEHHPFSLSSIGLKEFNIPLFLKLN